MNSHVIPINNMRVPYVRTGYEAIIPIRSDKKFVITAEDEGKVSKVTKSEVEIIYKSLGKKSYKIKDWTSKEESHACYTHVMLSNVKEGDKVTKDDTIIYDSSFFEPDIFNPKRVIYKMGDVVTVALMEDPETYEDSGTLAKSLSKRLGTTVTKIKSFVLECTDNVLDMKAVGSKVEPTDTLFTITDNMLPMTKLDDKTLEILKELKNKSPKAKIRGVISKIDIRYNCNIEDMSETLKTIVTNFDKKFKQDTGYTGKVSSSYSIEGKPLQPGEIQIKYYIQTDVQMGIGDKAIFGNQCKFTIGEVFENSFEAQDGTPIEATFSYRSINARIVNSAMLLGTTGMVLEKLTDKVTKLYFG